MNCLIKWLVSHLYRVVEHNSNELFIPFGMWLGNIKRRCKSGLLGL